jgi:hypothetical protein
VLPLHLQIFVVDVLDSEKAWLVLRRNIRVATIIKRNNMFDIRSSDYDLEATETSFDKAVRYCRERWPDMERPAMAI